MRRTQAGFRRRKVLYHREMNANQHVKMCNNHGCFKKPQPLVTGLKGCDYIDGWATANTAIHYPVIAKMETTECVGGCFVHFHHDSLQDYYRHPHLEHSLILRANNAVFVDSACKPCHSPVRARRPERGLSQ